MSSIISFLVNDFLTVPAILIVPSENDEDEDLLMLLMPMMLND